MLLRHVAGVDGALATYRTRGVESEFPGVRVLARSRSLSFEGNSDYGPYLSHLDYCVNLLQCI